MERLWSRLPVGRQVLAIALASRLFVLTVGLAAVIAIGFPRLQLPPAPTDSDLLNLPARWDTGWYVGLASGGYKWDGASGRFENLAFFPAYPLLLGGVARVFGLTSEVAWVWLGVALSTALFAAALGVLRRVALDHVGERKAMLCVCMCACYPFGIYFGLPYTESLFLLGVTSLFLAFERQRYLLACIAGIVTGLTRPTAFVASLALAAAVASRWTSASGTKGAWRGEWLVAVLAAASPLLGTAIYSAFVYGLTGDPLTWGTVQPGWGRATQNPAVALWEPFGALITSRGASALAAPHSLLNGLAGVVALGASVPIFRSLGAPYAILVVAGVLVPLTAGGGASLGRYSSVLFPLYVWSATAVPDRWIPGAVAGLLAIQAMVAALFFTWRPMY